MTRKTIYLHVGSHKTGTTAIQNFLFSNSEELGKQGFAYPSIGMPVGANKHNQLSQALNYRRRKHLTYKKIKSKLRNYLERSPHDKIIFSSEDFCSIRNGKLIHELFNGANKHDLKVILYIRRQDAHLQSLYLQRLKNIQHTEFPWRSIDEFIKSPPDEGDFLALLQEWEERFGKDNIILRVYERQQLVEGDVCLDFADAIGLKRTDNLIFPTRANNPTPSLDFIEFVKLAKNNGLLKLAPNIRRQFSWRAMDILSPEWKIEKSHQTYDLFSPKQKLEILKRYAPDNKAIAYTYLDRKDGVLFLDTLPDEKEHWQAYKGLTLDQSVQVSMDMWNKACELEEENRYLREALNRIKRTSSSIKNKTTLKQHGHHNMRTSVRDFLYPTILDAAKRFYKYTAINNNYIIHFSESHRYIYFETPKVGCTSIKRVLQYNELGCDLDRLPRDVHDKASSPLTAPKDDLLKFLMALRSKRYTRFTFVRNPYSRALSCYLDKAQNPWEKERKLPKLGLDPKEDVDFLTFLTRISNQKPSQMDIHWTPQSYLLNPKKIDFDFIGRFENFSEDARKIFESLNLKVPDELLGYGTRHSTGASNTFNEYYGEREKALVDQIYAEDFKVFNYEQELPE